MRPPDFDELIGPEVEHSERERLRSVHDLLVQAGPPAELSPQIEAGPTLAITLGRAQDGRRHGHRYRIALLAAALSIVALAFFGGYLTGNGRGHGSSGGTTLSLVGTPLAPDALASLLLAPADAAGNWPMQIAVTGLPKLPEHGYYTVFLVRHGKIYAPCGTFVVAGKSRSTSVWLNAPYSIQQGDTWVVTKQQRGDRQAGPIVLRPSA